MVSEVVVSVTTDEAFQIPSPSAAAAVSTASAMSKFMSEEVSRDVVNKYCDNLYDILN